jgi:hypothetical protein
MNERIKELVKQMGWEEMGADLYGKSMDGCMTIHALKKFAELIVKECISTLDQDDGATHHGELLREHFGVSSA